MKKAMWTIREIIDKQHNTTEINGRWFVARPLNYTLAYTSIIQRLIYAWYVLIGKHETFEYDEDQ